MDEEIPVMGDEQIEGENESSHKKVRHRKKLLYESVRNQMEFYFSDANLTKDRFLGKLLLEDPYIDLSIFIRFNKIRALTTNIKDIANSLRDSELLSVTEDGTKVFRMTPVKEKANTDDCTIYVEQLPPDAQHDWLKDVFSAYGKVAYVSVPKYKTSGKIKGFAFVEFETPEEAHKTLEAFGAMGCRLSSQIAPEKLCSIATFEPEGEGSENRSNEVDKKEISEKVNEEEDKLSRKKRKRKKGKQEYSEEASIEDGDEPEEERDDIPLKKRKRKKTQESEIEGSEEKAELCHVQPEDDGGPSSKKKRKRSEGSGGDETEGKKNIDDVDTSNVQQLDNKELHLDRKKCKRKIDSVDEATEETSNDNEVNISDTQKNNMETNYEKKQKRKNEDEAEMRVSEIQNEEEKVEKKKKLKSVVWNEEEVDETEVQEEMQEGIEVSVKKKSRKRKKKHKKDKPDVEASRLQILSKREWKRLRNKYLDLQKAKMKCLKQYLGRNRWNSNRYPDRLQQSNGHNFEKESRADGNVETAASGKQESEKKPRFTFTPGVIVCATLDEPVTDIRKFKVDAKALGEVDYVDILIGANQAFLRCSTAAAAEQLVSNAPWKQREILKGEDESLYWKKMTEDREQKLHNNIRVKQRGRDKILRRAERELGKHIRFDD